MKKTKIVATIGPSTTDAKKMEELLVAGVNVMRMNFSHGDFAEHQVKVDNARTVSGKNRNAGSFVAGFGRAENQNRRFLQRKRRFERRADFYLDYGKNCRRRKKSLCELRSVAPRSEGRRFYNAPRRKEEVGNNKHQRE